MLLTKTFVKHHDFRVYKWMEGLSTGLLPWDAYVESYYRRHNFVSALERKLLDTSLMEHNTAPIPLFLAWCLMTSNGSDSQFVKTRFLPNVIAEYCTRAWSHAVNRISADVKVSRAVSGYFTVAITLRRIAQMAVFLMGQTTLSQQYGPIPTKFGWSGRGSRGYASRSLCFVRIRSWGRPCKASEVVDKYRQINNHWDPCVYLTFCELVSGTPERTQILAEN